MVRQLIIASFLLSSAAIAGKPSAPPPVSGDFEIAYVKQEGTASVIYLTTATGSSTVRLYTSPSKASIASIDVKPGGGEIAFVERRSGAPWTIKVLSIGSNGVPGAVRTLSGPCFPDSLDYHPTDAVLIFSDVCSTVMNIARIGTDGSGYAKLQESPNPPPNEWWFGSPRWLSDGVSYVYARATDPSAQQLCRNDCAGTNLLWSGYQVGRMDTGRVNNRILFDQGSSYITEIDADSGALRRNIINGTGGHYGPESPTNPDDVRILYTTPHSAKGDYLQIWGPTGTVRVAAKGDYAASDWQP